LDIWIRGPVLDHHSIFDIVVFGNAGQAGHAAPAVQGDRVNGPEATAAAQLALAIPVTSSGFGVGEKAMELEP
jgi:hypothetical protein